MPLVVSFTTRPVPVKPLMLPPTAKFVVVQLTTTLLTLAEPTVPMPPLAMAQDCVGLVGCVVTVIV